MKVFYSLLALSILSLNIGCKQLPFSKNDKTQDYNNVKSIYFFNEAKIYMNKNEFTAAINYLDSCIKVCPGSDLLHNHIAYCYHVKTFINDDENNKIAIENLNTAIELNGNKAKYYHNRGICYKNLKMYSNAKTDFEKALYIDTTNIQYHHNILTTELITNQDKNALDYANYLIKKFPEDGYAYYIRGHLKRDYLKKYIEGNKDIELSEKLGWRRGFYMEL
tara:strand:- start:576 stop:1238 length:663 start_codon:yes stop_codon:yes gene_type:complete